MIIQGEQSNTGTCDTPSLAGAGSWLIGIGISDEASANPTGPSGWGDPLEINTAGDDFRYICWATKLTGAPAASYSITGGNPGFRIVAVIPEEGETLDDTIDVVLRDNEGGAAQTAASIDNVEADIRVVIAAFGNDSEFSISTPPEGWTQIGTVSGSPDSVSSAVFYRMDPEEDPIPGPTLVWSGSDAGVNFTILVAGTVEDIEPENVPPVVTITAPSVGSIAVTAGTLVRLVASATDEEDGDLSDSIEWTSSNTDDGYGGDLGTGAEIDVDTTGWEAGSRTITATVADTETEEGSDSITLTIGEAPPPAGGYLNALAQVAPLGGY